MADARSLVHFSLLEVELELVVAHKLLRRDLGVPLTSATLASGLVEGEHSAGNITEAFAKLSESL